MEVREGIFEELTFEEGREQARERGGRAPGSRSHRAKACVLRFICLYSKSSNMASLAGVE